MVFLNTNLGTPKNAVFLPTPEGISSSNFLYLVRTGEETFVCLLLDTLSFSFIFLQKSETQIITVLGIIWSEPTQS